MYIMNSECSQIINSDFVERFCIFDKVDNWIMVASYTDARPPVTLARYKSKNEAQDALGDLFAAMSGGQANYTLPISRLYAEECIRKDARVKRRGGS